MPQAVGEIRRVLVIGKSVSVDLECIARTDRLAGEILDRPDVTPQLRRRTTGDD